MGLELTKELEDLRREILDKANDYVKDKFVDYYEIIDTGHNRNRDINIELAEDYPKTLIDNSFTVSKYSRKANFLDVVGWSAAFIVNQSRLGHLYKMQKDSAKLKQLKTAFKSE